MFQFKAASSLFIALYIAGCMHSEYSSEHCCSQTLNLKDSGHRSLFKYQATSLLLSYVVRNIAIDQTITKKL